MTEKSMTSIRLNKYIADQGICSRREADRLITEGAVKINGIISKELGLKIDPQIDEIEVSDIALDKRAKQLVVYALNKPRGYVCSTHKTKIENKIFLDLFPKHLTDKHLYSIGRLDKDSNGLLIVTNDGDLAFKLSHPKFEHSKIYEVETCQPITDGSLKKLEKGVNLFGQKTLPANIKRLSINKFIITLTEGKNRQIRRTCRKVGTEVKILTRIQIGQLKLKDLHLQDGEFVQLSKEQIDLLKI